MSRPVIALALGAVFSAMTTGAFAQDGIPDLTGTWSLKIGTTVLKDGTVNQFPGDFKGSEIEITKQTGAVFTASQKIFPNDGTVTGTHNREAFDGTARPMVGALDGTGPYVVFAEVGDTSILRCTLVDEQTMRCLGAEAGKDAVAAFLLYTKQ